jgi:hypothetical protein
MFYCGIDWSEDHHNLCILNEAGGRVSQLQFEHSLAGFAQIEVERRKLEVPAGECFVGIETAYHLIVDFLLEHDYPTYIVPPQATKGYRNRQRSSGAHDDDSDAALLASIMRTDRESHRRLRPNLALTQQLLAQVRLIEILRRSIQRQSNQLRAVLFRTYPQAVGLFSDLTSQITLEFLLAYPTAQDAQTLSREAFEAFLRQHGYTRSDLIPLRYARLVEPFPSANPAVVQAYQGQVRALAQVILPQVHGRPNWASSLNNTLPHSSSHPWPAHAPSPNAVGNAGGSNSVTAAIKSSVASPNSSHGPQCPNRVGPPLTGTRSAPTAIPTHTPTASWPTVGSRSSGKCGKIANPMTKRITCINALSVANLEPEPLCGYSDLLSVP